MQFPEKYEIPIEKYPKDLEYKMGGPSMCIVIYICLSHTHTLTLFKRGSNFRCDMGKVY